MEYITILHVPASNATVIIKVTKQAATLAALQNMSQIKLLSINK
jgi:hypothetical protein